MSNVALKAAITTRDLDASALTTEPTAAINGWLNETAAPKYAYLLAWSLDGVTWARAVDAGGKRAIVTSSLLPDLSPGITRSLVELRLFTDDQGLTAGAQVHAWKTTSGWRAVETRDVSPSTEGSEPVAPNDTVQILAGTRTVGEPVDGFTVVREGQGLCHAVPLDLPHGTLDGTERALRLHVREYIALEDGVARVAHSRLSGISIEGN